MGCLVIALALVGSAAWNRAEHAQQAPSGLREALPLRVAATPTSPATAPPTSVPVPTATLAPTAAPSPTPVPEYGKPTWMTIPSIGVDSQIVEVGITDGVWNPVDREFSNRLVVVGQLVGLEPR